MARSLRRLRISRVSLVDDPASQDEDDPGFGAYVELFKRADPAASVAAGETLKMEELKAQIEKLEADLTKAAGDLEAAEALAAEEAVKREAAEAIVAERDADLAKAGEELAKANKPAADPMEGMSDDQRALITKARTDLEKANEKLAEIEAARDGEELAKAANGLSKLNVPTDLASTVLSPVRKASPEAFEALMAFLGALNEQVSTAGLFETKGKVGGGSSPEATEKINKRVDDLMRENPEMIRGDAFDKAYRENRELYSASRQA